MCNILLISHFFKNKFWYGKNILFPRSQNALCKEVYETQISDNILLISCDQQRGL